MCSLRSASSSPLSHSIEWGAEKRRRVQDSPDYCKADPEDLRIHADRVDGAFESVGEVNDEGDAMGVEVPPSGDVVGSQGPDQSEETVSGIPLPLHTKPSVTISGIAYTRSKFDLFSMRRTPRARDSTTPRVHRAVGRQTDPGDAGGGVRHNVADRPAEPAAEGHLGVGRQHRRVPGRGPRVLGCTGCGALHRVRRVRAPGCRCSEATWVKLVGCSW